MPRPAPNAFAPFLIAGVDEVGRGPLAGPVVAAAVVLDPRRPVDGLGDSKRLSVVDRERLDGLIRRRALAWCVASASVAEIDILNIFHANLLAMRRAVLGLAPRLEDGGAPGMAREAEGAPGSADGGRGDGSDGAEEAAGRTGRIRLRADGERQGGTDASVRVSGSGRVGGGTGGEEGVGEGSVLPPSALPSDPAAARIGPAPALVLVDGNRLPELPYPACAVVKGDDRVRAIAAASIVAKVARDALMRAWHEHYPAYGFARHKGYATREHRDALARFGVTPLHRCSFAPVRAALRAGAPNREHDA